MKRVLGAFMFLSLAASPEHADGSFIGIYADEFAGSCDSITIQYSTITVYFFAAIHPAEFSHLRSVEFKLNNPLIDGVDALVTFHWVAEQVAGDWGTDLFLAFDPPLDGPCTFIGSVDFFILANNTSNHHMEIYPADGQSAIWLVDDDTGIPVAGEGGGFTFNCTGSCGHCYEIANCDTPAEETAISSIKALY